MNVIVGLGNPGKCYENTPHNVGFKVVDELADRLACRLRRKFRFRARVGVAVFNGVELLLVKPQSYVNESGLPVSSVLRYHKVEPSSGLIVVVDDADLDVGQLRIRRSGGSGGHKGLQSIVRNVGSGDFTRVRLGIGRDDSGGDLVGHVLHTFSPEEQAAMDAVIKKAADAVMCILESGEEKAMNEYNRKKDET